MDPDWLLSEALKTVALFLAENDEIRLTEKPSSMHEEMFLRYQQKIITSASFGKGG